MRIRKGRLHLRPRDEELDYPASLYPRARTAATPDALPVRLRPVRRALGDESTALTYNMASATKIDLRRFSTIDELAPLRPAWNSVARGVPFRSFEWLESWWRAYGVESGGELLVLAAFDSGGLLVGLAPWYVERLASQRRVIRFLGSGEVCSDYLTVLCCQGREDDVTLGLADWLCPVVDDSTVERPRWDVLELNGVDEHDLTVRRLLAHLATRGCLVHRSTRASCWRVRLPADWNSYLATLSKSHRKQIRRLERDYFETSRARLHTVETKQELATGLEILIKLHQRRRESLGDLGRFSSARFAAFHEETARRLLHSGNLRLSWLDVDGRTVAAEYQVLGEGVVHAYQSGIEPEALAHQPGRLITIATIKAAIAEGRRAYDFLRGDETYKAHWRASPRPTHDIRVVSNTPTARLQHNLWLAGGQVKGWIKRTLTRSGMTSR